MLGINKNFSPRFIISLLKRNSPRIIFLSLAALLFPLFLTYLGWINAKADNENDALRSFESKIRETNQNILKKMRAYEQVLLGGIGLFASSDTVTREEWKTYVENLLIDKNFPGILGIGYSYGFKHSDSLRFVKAIQSEGFTNFRIWPEGIRDEYTSVIYIEPFTERNRRAFGYDLLSDSVRKSAMMMAKENGQTTISGKFSLVKESEYNIQAGFSIFIPLYKSNLIVSTVELRKALFKGYIYSPFKIRDLMQVTFGDELQNINIQIFDGQDTLRKNLMYQSDSLNTTYNGNTFNETDKLTLYGKTWTLKYTALPAFLDSFKSGTPVLLFILGIVISLLFSLVTFSFLNSKNTSRKLADVLKSTGEGIFGVDNTMTCTFINQSALAMLNYSLSDCINRHVHDFIICKKPDGTIYGLEECPLIQTVKNGKGLNEAEAIFLRKDKSIFPVEFSSHPVIHDGEITGTVVTFNDITERKKVRDQIEGSLREKEVLLREIHHRVKNNLQIISSLLNLQAGFSSDKKSNVILEESKNRVKSMALIHEKLYQSKNFSSLDIHEFLEELLKNLFNSYGVDSQTIKLELAIERINISADQAVYLGLIVNELVSNSMKHAFNNLQPAEKESEQKKICIKINTADKGYLIKICDNGKGFPANIDFRNTESLGLQLVMSLVKQLGGEIYLDSSLGTEFSIKFSSNA